MPYPTFQKGTKIKLKAGMLQMKASTFIMVFVYYYYLFI